MGIIPSQPDPLAIGSLPTRNKPIGELSENLSMAFKSGAATGRQGLISGLRSSLDPVVEEIRSVTGEDFYNPAIYMDTGILSAPASGDTREDQYSYRLREIQKYVADNKDKFDADFVTRVTDPQFDLNLRKGVIEDAMTTMEEADELFGRSPGAGNFMAQFVGGAGAAVVDPVNLESMVIGGAAKNLWSLAMQEALIGASIEGIQQPEIAEWYATLGLEYTSEDFFTNVGFAAVGGAAIPVAIAGAGRGASFTIDQAKAGIAALRKSGVELSPEAETLLLKAQNAEDLAAANPLTPSAKGEVEHKARVSDALSAVEANQPPAISNQPQTPPAPAKSIDAYDNLDGVIFKFDPDEIEVDAETFQFKAGGDAFGVTDRLQGITTWDPIKAGNVTIYEYADGRKFIADGHQRVGLAKRIKASDPGQDVVLYGMKLREVDGVSPQEAMVIAALKNISEGTGTAIDAAKVLRTAPGRVTELPPRSPFVRQARELTNLSDEAWGMVRNEVVPSNYAAIVGRLASNDPDMQTAAMGVLAKADPANEFQAEAIVRQVMATPISRETQENLFGEEMVVESLFAERAKILDRAQKQLRKDRATFKNLVDNQSRIEGEGNQLATESNQKRINEDGTAIAFLQSQANRKGAIADALNAAARNAKSTGNIASATRNFIESVRRAIDAGDYDSAAISDAGSNINAAAPERSVRNSIEQEQLDAFDDPGGSGAEDQARVFEQDFFQEMEALLPPQFDVAATINAMGAGVDRVFIQGPSLSKIQLDELVVNLKAAQPYDGLGSLMSAAVNNHAELNAVARAAARLLDLEFEPAPIKTPDRTMEKVRDKYAGNYRKIADVARTGVTVRNFDEAESFVARLAARFHLIDEGWATTPVGYFDRKIMVRFDDGQLGEIQIWPPGMRDAKSDEGGGGHKLYEISRDPLQSVEDRLAAEAKMIELYGNVQATLDPSFAQKIGVGAPRDAKASAASVAESSTALSSANISRAIALEGSLGSQSDPTSNLARPLSETAPISETSNLNSRMGNTSTQDIGRETVGVKSSVAEEDIDIPAVGESLLDMEFPTAERIDPDTGEIVSETITPRMLLDELNADNMMIDRLSRCPI
jgi:hypothetical protein